MNFNKESNKICVLSFLREAKSHVESGWCQGRFEGPNGTCCLLGALNRACENPDNKDDGYAWLHARFELQSGLPKCSNSNNDFLAYRGLSVWNDVPGRTVDEVLQLFTSTIERLENE